MESSAEDQKREILPILKRAQEVSASDPKMEYYCKLYAVEKAMSFSSRSPEVRDVLMAVLKQLECQKAELQLDREVDALHCAEFARDVFSRARARDEAGEIDVMTATTYNAACIFLEVAGQFDTPAADLQQMQQRAAERSREIRSLLFAAGASGTGKTGPGTPSQEACSAAGAAAADGVTSASSAAATESASTGSSAAHGEGASAGAAGSEASSELPRQEEAASGTEYGGGEAAGLGEGGASLQPAGAEQSAGGGAGSCAAEAGATADAGPGGDECSSGGLPGLRSCTAAAPAAGARPGSDVLLPCAARADTLATAPADAAAASLDGLDEAPPPVAAEDELSDGSLLPESRPESPPCLRPAVSPHMGIPDSQALAVDEPLQLPVPLAALQLLQPRGGAAAGAAATELDTQRLLALMSGLPPPLAAAAASHFLAPPSTHSAAGAAEDASPPPAWPESLPSPPVADSGVYPSLDLLQAPPRHAAPAPVPPVLANGHGNPHPSPLPSPPQSCTRPSAAAISEAQRAARTAVSSLNFEDTCSAVQHLQRALALLTPH